MTNGGKSNLSAKELLIRPVNNIFLIEISRLSWLVIFHWQVRHNYSAHSAL